MSFPFYEVGGIHDRMKFEDTLWMYLAGSEEEKGPLLKDIGKLSQCIRKIMSLTSYDKLLAPKLN